MKIALCTPVFETTKAEFTQSALAMVTHTLKRRPDLEIEPFQHKGSRRIDHAREDLAKRAIKWGADWLLWIDADHQFPPDTLLRLLAHDLPFVGCNFRRRNDRIVSSTCTISGVPIEPKTEGLQPVDLLGFGIALIEAKVFRSLPYPWFDLGPHGEDGYFCEQAINAGYTPHVDHALSREVGHISEVVLRFPD